MPSGLLTGVRVCVLVTNDVSWDARVQKECAALADAGAEVAIVGVGFSSSWSYPGVQTTLVPLPRADSQSIWPIRVLHNLLMEDAFERRLASATAATKPDIVHANDLDTLRSAFMYARRTTPVIYDAHELSTEGGQLPWWKRWLWRRREARYTHRATRVITVNDNFAHWLQETYRLSSLPVVVMNGPSERLEVQEVHYPVRLLFQGQFFNDRNLSALIDAVAPFAGKAVLALQGWGEAERALRAKVEDLGLQGMVEFRAPCIPCRTVRSAAESDVGLVVHKAENLNHMLASPNKLFDYFGAGLAVIASNLPTLRQMVLDTGAGLVFDSESVESLSHAIEELIDDPNRLMSMKRRASEVSRECSWDIQKEMFLDVYRIALIGKDA